MHFVADRISYTIDEAAAAIGVSSAFLRRAIKAGALPVHYVSPRKPLVKADDLLRWIEEAPLRSD